MKKSLRILAAALCVFAALTALTACTGDKPAENPGADMSVSEILDSVMSSVELEINTVTTELDAENFPYFAFIEQAEGMEGAVSEAMINAIAHSVVLVRVPDSEDPATVAQQIKDNANPAKWVCVEAEKTEVVRNGNLVLLVMSDTATADAVVKSFNTFCGV